MVLQLDMDQNALNGEIEAALHMAQLDAQDELDAVLTWINPNDEMSNHQMKPPSLRMKKCLNLLVNRYSAASPASDAEDLLVSEIRKYYIYQVRVHFFKHFSSIQHYTDMKNLEEYYKSPFQYVALFEGPERQLWVEELQSLRRYLINRNSTFRKNLENDLRNILANDDFTTASTFVHWLNSTDAKLPTYSLVLNLMLEKISQFCQQHMSHIWNNRYLVVETFNLFITQHWITYARLLNCPENDHNVTTVIFQHFEREFVRLRTRDIFQLSLQSTMTTKDTLLELKKSLVESKDITELVVHYLSDFEKHVLNPSVRTANALLAYIRGIKIMQVLDPTAKWRDHITSYVNPHLRARPDLVRVLLYAILDTKHEEVQMHTNQRTIKLLSEELNQIEFGFDEIPDERPFMHQPEANNDQGPMLYQEIMRQMLEWTPDPVGLSSTNQDSHITDSNLFDILLDIFESKDFFISEFIKLLTGKLLRMKYYKLDENWKKCLRLLGKKFKGSNVSGSFRLSNSTMTGDKTAINNIDVMLWDIKYSNKLCSEMHKNDIKLDKNIYPKFISPMYWQEYANTVHERKCTHFKIDDNLQYHLDEYSHAYSRLEAGRKLRLCKDEGIIELELSFEDGRRWQFDVTFPQASVIQLLQKKGFSKANKISSKLQMPPEQTESALNYWVRKKVLYCDSAGAYKVREYLLEQDEGPENKHNLSINEGSNVEEPEDFASHSKTTEETLHKVWPFIEGMLTNLGSTKAERIHSFLKVIVPRELGYNTVTLFQLEAYLNVLVEEEKLTTTSMGAFKLAK